MDQVAEVLPRIVERLRSMSSMWDDFQKGKVKSQIR